jgi:hypothetical protein
MKEPLITLTRLIAHDSIDLIVEFTTRVLARTAEVIKDESGKLSQNLKDKVDKKLEKKEEIGEEKVEQINDDKDNNNLK